MESGEINIHVDKLNNFLREHNVKGNIRFDILDTKDIRPTEQPNIIDTEEYEELEEDIIENGFIPLFLSDEVGEYTIWDGNHRYFILKKIGMEKIPVYIYSGEDFDGVDIGFFDYYTNNGPLVPVKPNNSFINEVRKIIREVLEDDFKK
jgi:hypothetical protein